MDRTFEGTHSRTYAHEVRIGDKMIDPRIPVKKANPNDHQWATYIADRSPRFNIHRTLGHAHAAISWKTYGRRISADMALYVKDGDDWVVQHEWQRGEQFTHFPWQTPPPSPEEQAAKRREDEWARLKIHLATFIGSLDDVEFEARLNNARQCLNTIEKNRTRGSQ